MEVTMEKVMHLFRRIFGIKKKVKAPAPILTEQEAYDKWINEGKPVPAPELYKRRNVAEYAKNYNIGVLVETGTYEGGMIDFNKNNFTQIYSIELSDDLFEKAVSRFKEYGHIKILHGDSGVKIKEILDNLDQPAIFWLDAHYSGGKTALGEQNTPIEDELEHIMNHKVKNHVILIDDARKFDKDDYYPTIAKVKELLSKYSNDYNFEIKHDVIRITFGK